MAQKLNSFERFWNELKRRKVIHVITVYAAVSFVILQLVDIVAEPLRLPVSTKALVIVLLCIGVIIAVFVSWVYDITPAGVKKTKPVSTIKHGDQIIIKTTSGWKIATYVSGVIIIALIAFNFISKRNLNADISKLEKSIAVLPFRNDSRDSTNQYFINGIMEEILTSLQKIGAFSRVLSRNSVEQFRNNTTKSTPEIAKALNVNFIVEGSGQKYGNKFVLRVQLITGKNERHLWAKSYDREIMQTTDIVSVQSEIAQLIAAELKATITPEEKQLIEKIPTNSLTAHDFYLRGNEELSKYLSRNPSTRVVLDRADELYKKALELDPSFAQAYIGLAQVYWNKHYFEEYLSKNFLDSVCVLCDKALSYNDQLSEAHNLKGNYYWLKGNTAQAKEEFDKALRINPNSWEAYSGIRNLYFGVDHIKYIDNSQKAASLNHGPELSDLLVSIAGAFWQAGFNDKSEYYLKQALILNGDSAQYYIYLMLYDFWNRNFEKALDLSLKTYELDTTRLNSLSFAGFSLSLLGRYEESLKYYKKFIEKSNAYKVTYLNNSHRIGYAFWKNGYKKEADYYFDKQIEYSNASNKLGRPYGKDYWAYYDLAAVYAFRGEKNKTFENLRFFSQIKTVQSWGPSLLKFDPLLDSIRNEPEFQQIVRDVEAKYQAEHERVRKWLEETGQL
jgi:TolB-like protein